MDKEVEVSFNVENNTKWSDPVTAPNYDHKQWWEKDMTEVIERGYYESWAGRRIFVIDANQHTVSFELIPRFYSDREEEPVESELPIEVFKGIVSKKLEY